MTKILLTNINGRSAYQVAVDEGFVGTEEAWLLSLKGASGDVTPAATAAKVAAQDAAVTATSARNEVLAAVFPAATVVTYNAQGNVETVTVNGILTTYTYNLDGSVATDTRSGVTRTYSYDTAGNLIEIEAA